MKRVVWFGVFMLWIGMVSAILVYQNGVPQGLADVSNSEITTQTQSVSDSTMPSTNNVVIDKVDETDHEEEIDDVEETSSQKKEKNQDFFVQYRLDRDKARSEQINIYRDMINNPNADPSVKKDAQKSLLELTEHIEQEMEIESLIRAQNLGDALAYMHQNSIDIIIQTDRMNEKQAAIIGDIVTRITDLKEEEITIIEKRKTNTN